MADVQARYANENPCQKSGCRNKARWTYGGGIFCGVHMKHPDRIALPINPNAVEVRQTELTRLLKLAEVVKTASIRLAKKQMMRALPMPEGFYIILPNNKDRGVQFGGLVLGMCDLSPMQLGPVEHGQPNLPPATNIENFHQSNKVFPSEVDAYGNPLPIWYTRREEGYRNPVPFRHKLGKTKAEHILASGCESANKPLYSIFVQRDGTERRCTYLESRVYYCTYYEQLVRQTDSYKQLVAMLESGK